MLKVKCLYPFVSNFYNVSVLTWRSGWRFSLFGFVSNFHVTFLWLSNNHRGEGSDKLVFQGEFERFFLFILFRLSFQKHPEIKDVLNVQIKSQNVNSLINLLSLQKLLHCKVSPQPLHKIFILRWNITGVFCHYSVLIRHIVAFLLRNNNTSESFHQECYQESW